MNEDKLILVGDNPFHGVSHLSQTRTTDRSKDITQPEYAAKVVTTAFKNGANGFMFTSSQVTLPILTLIGKKNDVRNLRLQAIVPYAYDFVRESAAAGGLPGLARKLVVDVILQSNLSSMISGGVGIIANNPSELLKSYLAFEVNRIKAAGRGQYLESVMLHEVVTDMALALDMDWVFRTHISYLGKHGIKPGFETRNYSYLVKKFKQWQISFKGIFLAAPFNAVGFQMVPSREEWETTLLATKEADVVAFSILAAGYLNLPEAIDYINHLSNLKGVAVGVSSVAQAEETFGLIAKKYGKRGGE